MGSWQITINVTKTGNRARASFPTRRGWISVLFPTEKIPTLTIVQTSTSSDGNTAKLLREVNKKISFFLQCPNHFDPTMRMSHTLGLIPFPFPPSLYSSLLRQNQTQNVDDPDRTRLIAQIRNECLVCPLIAQRR